MYLDISVLFKYNKGRDFYSLEHIDSLLGKMAIITESLASRQKFDFNDGLYAYMQDCLSISLV